MKNATLEQGTKVLTLISQKETPCEQLQNLLASGLLTDLLDANVVEVNRDAFRKVIGLKPLSVSAPSFGDRILTWVRTVSVPGVTKFVAADHFKVGTTDGVRIAYVTDRFRRIFGGKGKIERNVKGATLNGYMLTKLSWDSAILTELGDRAEIPLAHVWELLKGQSNFEDGPLAIQYYLNVFYVRDVKGTRWAVQVHPIGGRALMFERPKTFDGWAVDVEYEECINGWSAGSRVFSR
jgi:hypothetical protein